MKHIEAVAAQVHICAESVRAIEPAHEDAHHGKHHQPGIKAVKPAGEVLGTGIVPPPSCDAERHARCYGAHRHRNAHRLHTLKDAVVAEYEIAHQEWDKVCYRPIKIVHTVQAFRPRIHNNKLRTEPYQHAHQNDNWRRCFCAEIPELVIGIQPAYQQEQQREYPQLLCEPERTASADRVDQPSY